MYEYSTSIWYIYPCPCPVRCPEEGNKNLLWHLLDGLTAAGLWPGVGNRESGIEIRGTRIGTGMLEVQMLSSSWRFSLSFEGSAAAENLDHRTMRWRQVFLARPTTLTDAITWAVEQRLNPGAASSLSHHYHSRSRHPNISTSRVMRTKFCIRNADCGLRTETQTALSCSDFGRNVSVVVRRGAICKLHLFTPGAKR